MLTEFHRLSKLVKPRRLKKPRRLVGGESVQEIELDHNTFGATVSADFAHIFNPVTREDRARVAKHGYVRSLRRDRYIEPIDRVVRASMPAQAANELIDDTNNPREIITPLRNAKQLEHQVMLIVGGVGAGKSTFIDRLREVSLPKEVKARTFWVHIDMNVAPVAASEIYDWLRREIVAGCKVNMPDLDFDDLDTMKRVYSVEVNKFKKTTGKLLASQMDKYNVELAATIDRLENDPHSKATCYSRFCTGDRGKLLILVFDNCDKRTRDEQLLMFQAAQWLQREFRALVVLPLREETYDNHRNQPPLDTALKNLVFRIEPPLFHQVLVKRVQLALDAIEHGSTKKHRFNLPNGFHVQYSASNQAFFLSSIVRSIFVHDYQIRRLIVGLAGRDLRRALEIFLEFCNSGHIGEDEIVRIVQSKGEYILSLDLVVRVLVRMSRRFYDGDHSFIKNLFSLDPSDARPNYFIRLMIVRWLREHWDQVGPAGFKGYFPIRDICAELNLHGVETSVAVREIEYLVRAKCVLTEDLRVDQLNEADLVRLGPAGFVHLELLGNINYLAAVAEDTWFASAITAADIAARIKLLDTQYSDEVTMQNARDLLDMLGAEREIASVPSLSIVNNSSFAQLSDLTTAHEAIKRKGRSNPWLIIEDRYPLGAIVPAVIVNVVAFGVFAELEPGFTGLIHISKLPKNFREDVNLSVAEQIQVKVLKIDTGKQRISLGFVKAVPFAPERAVL